MPEKYYVMYLRHREWPTDFLICPNYPIANDNKSDELLATNKLRKALGLPKYVAEPLTHSAMHLNYCKYKDKGAYKMSAIRSFINCPSCLELMGNSND